jgi:hypothetical protein
VTTTKLIPLLLGLLFSAVANSADIGIKKQIDISQFEVGKTLIADVVRAIGLPQRMSKDENGTKHFFYERSTRLVGMCLGCGMAGNTMGLISGGAIKGSKEKAKKNSLELVFDSEGILQSGS